MPPAAQALAAERAEQLKDLYRSAALLAPALATEPSAALVRARGSTTVVVVCTRVWWWWWRRRRAAQVEALRSLTEAVRSAAAATPAAPSAGAESKAPTRIAFGSGALQLAAARARVLIRLVHVQ